MNRVKDKVCIVTGAALGIGRACALRLAQEGARIAVFDVLDIEGEDLATGLKAQGFDAAYWHVDVASEAEVARAIADVAARFGAVNVLVNNAGIAGANKPTHELTEAEWDHVQAVNVKGVFFCTKHVIPQMRRAGYGSIINLSSIYGLVGAADVPPYHASIRHRHGTGDRRGLYRTLMNRSVRCSERDIRPVSAMHRPRVPGQGRPRHRNHSCSARRIRPNAPRHCGKSTTATICPQTRRR